MLGRELRHFLQAVVFLTRLSVGRDVFAGSGDFPVLAVKYLPVVGGMIGGFGGVILVGLFIGGGSGLLASILAIAVVVVLTRGMHEDGFADTLDGFGVRGDIEAKRRAMREGSVGVYAVLGLMVVFLLRVISLGQLVEVLGVYVIMVWFLAGLLSRWLMLVPLVYLPALGGGVSGWFGGVSGGLFWGIGGVILVISGVMGVILGLWSILIGVGGVMVMCWLLVGVFRRHFGGYSGDMAGMCAHSVEVGFLVVIALLLG